MKWKKFRKRTIIIKAYRTNVAKVITTLEGQMQADIGDWIIEGIKGELYPCKPDIFDRTYEPVED